MSNHEHFRVDCLVQPFVARSINGHQFEPAFDNPALEHPTGLHYVGPLSPAEVELYKGIDVFPITRLGGDAESAHEAHEALKQQRAQQLAPHLFRAAPKAKAPTPAAAVTFTPGKDSQGGADDAADTPNAGDASPGAGDNQPDGDADGLADKPKADDAAGKATGKKAAAKDAK